ncbi:MAG: cob(I)yrinic acid a,c-diamide adenosyltransferase [Nitrospira bacterium HGW-Nitrospira-1]|nr:MAG: cob(I)yrinic acid a,c-diamide adenosyltransferase [Nitrospira bacterium HGW-Nitrospira-1]
MSRGYIQVYTGNGKGKTTAALGLALRAAGAGLKVFIAQFIKKQKCSEHRIIRERLNDLITVKQYGEGFILKRDITPSDRQAAQKGLLEIREIIKSNEYNMLILDEVNVAVHYKLVSLDDLLDLMESKPEGVELIITGRYAQQEVISRADLVTEMKEIRHYGEKGVKARKGTEY